MKVAEPLAAHLALGSLLEEARRRFGSYQLVEHYTQGEFHHDVVLKVADVFVVVATNCNGGVKEVLCFDELPTAGALWHWRCAANPEFSGALPVLLERAVTEHWFDPSVLLADDARSELRPECRVRQPGSGWMKKPGA